jgi:sporulation protein YlmC with PRC-barrel domain
MIRNLSPAVAALAVAAALALPGVAADLSPNASSTAGSVGTAGAARATEMIGKVVTNRMDQKIGTVDDFLITRDGRVSNVVLSVGGFLGVGNKLVTVPYSDVEKRADSLVINRTADEIRTLPEFKYDVAVNVEGSRDTYIRGANERMSEWDKRMADWKQSAKNASSDAGKRLDSAWNTTKQKFAEMKDASADGWDRARQSFDKAWNDLQSAWKDATS